MKVVYALLNSAAVATNRDDVVLLKDIEHQELVVQEQKDRLDQLHRYMLDNRVARDEIAKAHHILNQNRATTPPISF